MAEESVEKPSGPNHLVEVVLFLLVILAVGALLSGTGWFTVSNPDVEETLGVSEKADAPLFKKIFHSENFELGKNVISIDKIQVRSVPGGSILGVQEKLAKGRLMEGSIEKFNSNWWRVSFEEAPSGWVEETNLTTRTGLAKTFYFPVSFYRGWKPIGWTISIILIIIIFIIRALFWREIKISNEKLRLQYEQTQKKQKEKTQAKRKDLGLPTEEEFKNPRWQHIQELMKTNNQNDWRQAIIEADIVLDEMLRRMSYDGLTIGDMLKQVDPADFITLEKAWEAHKFRNEIAHTGSEFKLSREEAERVINLYRAIFDEFYYV